MEKVRVRKLTPKECWRLMGFDDIDFENAKYYSIEESMTFLTEHPKHKGKREFSSEERIERISNTQLYKQAGNSIVVDVLVHIMENLYDAMPYLFDDMEIGSFFSGIGAFEKALTRLDPDSRPETNDAIKDLELTQVGYINGYNGDANRIYDGSTVSRALKAEAGGGGAKTGWYMLPPSVILDVKQMGREGAPRCYTSGITPTLAARDYKDPLRVTEISKISSKPLDKSEEI